MPIIDGVKLSCQVCLRGHRSAVCNHSDRELFPVRPKGRPPRADGNSKRPMKRARRQEDKDNGKSGHHADSDNSPSPSSRMSVHTLVTRHSIDPFARSTSKASRPPSPKMELATSTFDLDLDCTCPDPCPCPGCPGKRHGKEHKSSPPTQQQDHTRKGCCTAESEVVVPPDKDVCGSCLPCIIAPYEKSSGEAAVQDTKVDVAESSCCA